MEAPLLLTYLYGNPYARTVPLAAPLSQCDLGLHRHASRPQPRTPLTDTTPPVVPGHLPFIHCALRACTFTERSLTTSNK